MHKSSFMVEQLTALVASIAVGRIPRWAWAVAKTLLVTVWSYVKGQPGAHVTGRGRTVKSPMLEGALLKSRGHPLIFCKSGAFQTRNSLRARLPHLACVLTVLSLSSQG